MNALNRELLRWEWFAFKDRLIGNPVDRDENQCRHWIASTSAINERVIDIVSHSMMLGRALSILVGLTLSVADP